ncbi:hypothetical protein [Sphingomonas sp. ID0503]|uniref:hypothetical protein n=1 Tax=Sphingomonas sp. ID0503 TaxID=3399691 RepID=UPI003AFB4366
MNEMDESAVATIDRRGGGVLRLLAAVLIAFVIGLIAAGWALARSPDLRNRLLGAPVVVTRTVPVPVQPVSSVRAVAARLGSLEQKVAEVDEKSAEVAGNADRAEGLLLTFAARRALDRGLELGYLEGLLREHYGASDPQAVATIIAASRRPITLDQLRRGLGDLPTGELVADKSEGWWPSFKRELAGIVIVKRVDTPVVTPDERLSRARTLIDDGQVDRALAEVSRLPGRDKAAGWISEARRYVTSRNALDRIEMATLLAPRG